MKRVSKNEILNCRLRDMEAAGFLRSITLEWQIA